MGVDSPDWTGTQQNSGQVLVNDVNTITADPFTFDLSLPGWCRTLFVSIPFTAPRSPQGPTLKMVGDQSGYTYINNQMQIRSGAHAYYAVAVSPALDQSLTVTVSGLGSSIATPDSMMVAADPNDDSVQRFLANLYEPATFITTGTFFDAVNVLRRPLPIDVVQMGGESVANVVAADANTHQVIAAPALNFATVLKSFSISQNPPTAGALPVLIGPSNENYAISSAPNIDVPLEGKLAQVAVSCQLIGNGATAYRCTVTYDTVALPFIQ